MTTKITVHAACSDDEEVVIQYLEGADPAERAAIHNGEVWEGHVYDDRTVQVYERPKSET